jgi:phenylacetic acid degradation operon negative regulatory protein
MSQSRNTLTARSVLLSVLLGTDPPRLPVRLLVRTTELFGFAEGTVRTALSRMAAAGEVVAEDGWYALAADRLLARQARQTASRAARTRPWPGSEPGSACGTGGRWIQAVVVATGRRPAGERAQLRVALASARLAELREGVWLRPDNLDAPWLGAGGDAATRSADAAEVEVGWPAAGGDIHWFRAVPDGDPASLAARLWDLDAWAAAAADLRQRMAGLVDPLAAGDRGALADGFVLSADVLRHLQADPLLPALLLPAGWPGGPLRDEYDRYDAAYRAVLGDWFGEHR